MGGRLQAEEEGPHVECQSVCGLESGVAVEGHEGHARQSQGERLVQRVVAGVGSRAAEEHDTGLVRPHEVETHEVLAQIALVEDQAAHARICLAQVPGRGEDRVGGVVGIVEAVAVGVDSVLAPR